MVGEVGWKSALLAVMCSCLRMRGAALQASCYMVPASAQASPLNRPMHPSPAPRRSTLSGVLNIAGMLFASTLFVGFTNCMTVQHTVEVQR